MGASRRAEGCLEDLLRFGFRRAPQGVKMYDGRLTVKEDVKTAFLLTAYNSIIAEVPVRFLDCSPPTCILLFLTFLLSPLAVQIGRDL